MPDLTGLSEPLARAEFWESIAEHVFDDLLEEYLRIYYPGFYLVLRLWGVVRFDAMVPIEPSRNPYTRISFDWERALSAVKDPLAALKLVYHWGDAAQPFAYEEALAALAAVMHAFGVSSAAIVPALADKPPFAGDPTKRILNDVNALRMTFLAGDSPVNRVFYKLGLEAYPAARSRESTPTGLMVKPILQGGAGNTLPLGNSFSLIWSVAAALEDAVGFAVFPGEAHIVGGAPAIGTSLTLARAGNEPLYLLGNGGTSRVEVSAFSVSASLVGSVDDPEIKLSVACSGSKGEPGCRIVVPLDDCDEFVKSTVTQPAIDFPFSPQLVWSSKSGLTFDGNANLSIGLPLNISLGPVSLIDANIALGEGARTDSSRSLACRFGFGIRGSLGPITFVVDKIGFVCEIAYRTRDDMRALPASTEMVALGPLGLDLEFAPPKGIGISVEAQGVVTGGGFLFHDPARQLYAGVMQLSLHDQLTVTAFGLISTRMPDGSKGYSLIIFITAEDFQPIPLGLGFTLQGIGGMVAINRTFDEAVLRAGMQNDTLRSLLFPRDPVANAPAIISALASAFPARGGSYLMGIVVRIGWGTPTLIRLDLALILEFGERQRLLALGRISALLPSPDNDLVRLNLDAMGVLDLDQGSLAIDAVLVDSRLVHKFALTGAGALRAGGSGAGSGFVLAVGGFNPRFAPPAAVPTLSRVMIALSSGNNPRLTCEAYFAITSNTVQFGARAQLHAEAYGFSVDGDVGFDVLISRSPLHFIADFHASAQLKHGSHNLFKVSLEGALEGPRPLRASGKASFEIFWCDFTVRFDKTLIDGDPPPLPPAINVQGQLLQALSNAQSWRTDVPAGRTHGVALRKLAPGAPLVIDPLGRLVVRQDVVPLNTGRDIDLFGGSPVAGARRFALGASLNGVDAGAAADAAGGLRAGAVLRHERRREAGQPVVRGDGRGHGGRQRRGDGSTRRRRWRRRLEYESIVIDTLAPPGNPPPPLAGALCAGPLAAAGAQRDRRGGARAGAARRAGAVPHRRTRRCAIRRAALGHRADRRGSGRGHRSRGAHLERASRGAARPQPRRRAATSSFPRRKLLEVIAWPPRHPHR